MTRPMTPTANDAAMSGRNQSQNDVSALENPQRADRGAAAETLLEIEGEVAAEQVERPVCHVDDAHQPEDQRESARDDEEEARERETEEQDAEEDPGLLDEGFVREDEDPKHHEERERRDGDPDDDPSWRRRAESLLPRKLGRSSVCLLTHRVRAAPRGSALIPAGRAERNSLLQRFQWPLTRFSQWLSKAFMQRVQLQHRGPAARARAVGTQPAEPHPWPRSPRAPP